MGLASSTSPERGRRCATACAPTLAILFGFVIAFVMPAYPAAATPLGEQPNISLYGTPGILETPSARSLSDAEFATTVALQKPDNRFNLTFQALPGFEVTARYVVNQNFYGGGQSEFDRSIGFKLKLMNEGEYWPALAIGALDLGGTVLEGGEYIVTSKNIGPFDTSLGLGFGRLGSVNMFDNPLGLISKRFNSRPGGVAIGSFALNQLFRGQAVSLFGGVIYDTPIRGLHLLAEYSGDSYAGEQGAASFRPRTQVNVGLAYRPAKFIEIGAGWLYGREASIRVTIDTNFKTGDQGTKLDPPPLATRVRSDDETLRNQLRSDLQLMNSSADARRPSKVDRDRFSNLPDLALYPVPDDFGRPQLVAEEIAAEPSTSPSNDAAIADISNQLAQLDMAVTGATIKDGQAVINVAPKSGQGPLACEVLWHQVAVSGLNGVDAVTFINIAGNREIYRCTKLIDHQQAPLVAEAVPPSPVSPAQPSPDAATDSDDSASPLMLSANDPKKVLHALAAIFHYQGLAVEAFKLSGNEAIIYFDNITYQKTGKALGRAARAATQVLPPNVEVITLVETNGAINGTQFRFSRAELERVAQTDGSAEEILASTGITPARPGFGPNPNFKGRRWLRVFPLLAPAFRQSLFDPDNPFRYQVLVRAGATVELMRGITIAGVYDINVYNDFNQIKRVSDSVLPHVRSDFRLYLQQGASGVESLQLAMVRQLSPEWTARFSAGYLEPMYAGVAGEILYAPFAHRWMIGLDVEAVKQRNFNELFGFRRYHTITGNLTVYYQTPFHNVDVQLSVGRYLARDKGMTIQFNRHFDNGAEVGIWATFTNVPFSKFGEGSFDKGIRLTIPLDFYSLFSSRQSTTIELRPVTRDGGAMVDAGPKLYPIVRQLSYGDAYRTFDDFLDEQ